MQTMQTMQTTLAYQRDAGSKYREQSILTASPGDLVTLLYEGCIKNVRLAKLAIEENDIPECSNRIMKARDIIEELVKGLDFTYPISNEFYNLYEFLIRELIQCNITKKPERLDGVEKIVTEIKAVWEEAVQQCRIQRMS